jgi:hypothetical protein
VVLPLKPDGDPTEPLDRRPLNLLAVIYRCWARLRGREVAAWRRSWDPACAAARLGADGQAWELGWAQAEAEALDLEFGGLAVDFRKAYDSVRLALVARLLAAAGWPAALAGPLQDMYCAPRRLRVAGALGAPFLPTSGIPAGCPIAVDLLAVLTWAWHKRASALPKPLTLRRYVDDLTAWGYGPMTDMVEAIPAVHQCTHEFAAAFQLDVHPTNTVEFAASVTLRRRLGAADVAAVVRDQFRDLGVIQVFGRTGAALAAGRRGVKE